MSGVLANSQRCAEALGRWNARNRRSLSQDIRVLQEKLRQVSGNIGANSWVEIQAIEKALGSLLDQDEAYWKQRSRNMWLKGGDKNSRFFHWKASARRTNNKISGLFDDSGSWKEDNAGIFQVVETYFSTVFASSNPSNHDIARVLDCVHPCLFS
jgi:hypothetical protein